MQNRIRAGARMGHNALHRIGPLQPGEAAFFIARDHRQTPLGQTLTYGELASGRIYLQSDPIGLAGGMNTYGYADGSPTTKVDLLGLATYMCTQPLHALGAAGDLLYGPSWNPLYHQFLGIVRPDGSVITGGQDRAGGPWGPGKPSEGDGTSGKQTCEKAEDDNECIEKCLMGKFAAPRPKYGLILGSAINNGKNCQGWANDTLAQCRSQCKGKK